MTISLLTILSMQFTYKNTKGIFSNKYTFHYKDYWSSKGITRKNRLRTTDLNV